MGKLPLIALKLITRDLGSLNKVVQKIDYVVKLTQVCQTRLLGFLAAQNFVCAREQCPRNRKTKQRGAQINILQSEWTKL